MDNTLDINSFDFTRKTSKALENPEAHCTEVVIPVSYEDAMQSPQAREWHEAMQDELNVFKEREVMDLVDTPNDKRVIGCRWIYTTKTNELGEVIRYKARLVAKGFGQIEGVDYEETFSPVVNISLIRLFLILLVLNSKWCHYHYDVKNAYLYGNLDETIYMQQPPGFKSGEPASHRFHLRKAIYGLRQSGRSWYEELDKAFLQLGFQKFQGTNCIYLLNDKAVILVYVDDLIVFAENAAIAEEV